jgi:hypothetical protein
VIGDVVDVVGDIGDFPFKLFLFFGRKLTRRLVSDGERFVELV